MGTWTTILTAVGAVLAIWSMSWIVRAQRDNGGERGDEVLARARVAKGQGWEGSQPPKAFTDAELLALVKSQEAMTLDEAGVEARPAPVARRRLLRRSSIDR